MPSPRKKRSRQVGGPGGGGNGKSCWLNAFIPYEACPLQADCQICPYCRPVNTPRLKKVVCSFTGRVLWKEAR